MAEVAASPGGWPRSEAERRVFIWLLCKGRALAWVLGLSIKMKLAVFILYSVFLLVLLSK